MTQLKAFVEKHSKIAYHLALITGLGFIYGSQFKEDHFLNYDDQQVLGPMENIHSLSEYISEFKKGLIYDVQPVRDLLTYLDYFVKDHFGLSVFHLTNVLVWWVALLGLKKLIDFLPSDRQKPWLAGLLLVAFNPLYVPSVSWLSARKHLLAAAFAVWATYYLLLWLRRQMLEIRPLIVSVILYTLAVFSQPIVLFWPFLAAWLLVVYRAEKRWYALTPFFIVMAITAYLNYLYYTGPLYLKLSMGNSKFSDNYNHVLSIRLFAIGRYIFQIFIPYWTSISIYDVRSWKCLTGIFLLPVSFYLLWKSTKLNVVLTAYLIFLLMLIPVTARMTQIFGSDTYVIAASFGIYFAVVDAVLARFSERKLALKSVFCLLLVAFLGLSFDRAQAWESDFLVFHQARDLENGVELGEQYLHELMVAKRMTEAVWYAEDILKDRPNSPTAQGVIAYAISNDPELTTLQKIQKIYDLKFFTPFSLDILAKLEFSIKNFRSSENLLLTLLGRPDWGMIVLGNEEAISARIFASCERAGDQDCEKKAASVRTKAAVHWNDSKYESEKTSLLNQ